MFLACGQNGQRVISDDGISWKNHSLGKEGEVYKAACFGNGRMVCVGTYGGQNIMSVSTDGVAWKTSSNNSQYKSLAQGVGFGNGMFLVVGGEPVTVGGGDPFVMTSTDGEKWSDILKTEGKFILRRVAYGNGLWAGVGDRGRRASSKDGKIWQDTEKVKAVDTLVDVAFGNGVFVGVGLHSLRMTSKDGLLWENKQVGLEGEHLNSIVWAENRFVGIGMTATYFSPDGITWERKENKNGPITASYAKGAFVGAAWKGRLLHSADALEWKEVFKSEQHFEAVTGG